MEQDTPVAARAVCSDSTNTDTFSDNPDRFTDNKGRSYIAVRICELDRFCLK